MALEHAKYNLEKKVTAFGFLEDLNATFHIFQETMPQYMAGLVRMHEQCKVQIIQETFSYYINLLLKFCDLL